MCEITAYKSHCIPSCSLPDNFCSLLDNSCSLPDNSCSILDTHALTSLILRILSSVQFMVEHSQADIELVHAALRPLLMTLGDYRNLTPPLLVRLTYMIELFPTSFNEKMCNSLMAHLRNWIEVLQNMAAANAASSNGGVVDRNGDEVTVCLHIMTMLHMLPASTFRLFEPLLALSLKGEKALGIEVGVVFYVCVWAFNK